MYLGITAHRAAKPVRSFADAQAALAKAMTTPTGRARKPSRDGMYPLGLTKRGQTTIAEMDDGSIAFRLYSTDVVTWHPDNSFSIDNYGTVTTSSFAARFTPQGFYLRHPSYRRGESGGDHGITYPTVVTEDYRERWASTRICFGPENFVVFRPTGDGVWEPDEDTLAKIVLPELDRPAARKLAQTLHLRDFENWLSMAPHHLDLEHEGMDLGHVALALKHRDFAKAAVHLPLMKMDSFGRCHDHLALPIVCRGTADRVTLGSIQKLKLGLWEDHSLLKDRIATTMPLADYDRDMRRVRALGQLGFDGLYGARV